MGRKKLAKGCLLKRDDGTGTFITIVEIQPMEQPEPITEEEQVRFATHWVNPPSPEPGDKA
jgi:hypothetical protein